MASSGLHLQCLPPINFPSKPLFFTIYVDEKMHMSFRRTDNKRQYNFCFVLQGNLYVYSLRLSISMMTEVAILKNKKGYRGHLTLILR